MTHRRVTVAAGVLGAALALTAWSSGSRSIGMRSVDAPLTIGQTANLVGNFNPYRLSPGNFVFMYQLYDTLIRQDAALNPQPRLASSWEFSRTGHSLTLHLRSATFSNGQPITSQIVADDIALVKQPATGANIIGLAAEILAVRTPDPRTVVLDFGKAYPGVWDFLNLLFITDPATVSSVYLTVDASGPFQLSQYTPGVSFTMTPNPDFWGVKPKLSSVTVKILPDEQTLVNSLQAGAIDFAGLITPLDYSTLKTNSAFSVGVAAAANSVLAFSINVTRPPLDKLYVRRALSLALNRQRIADDFLGGAGSPACLPFNTPTQLGYDKTLSNYCKFDLNTAKKLIIASGVGNVTFTILTSTSTNPVYTQMAEVFQADLATIGVTANIQDVDLSTFSADQLNSNFDIIAVAYGRANLDPSTLFGATAVWNPAQNESSFKGAMYSSLVAQGGSTYNKALRAKVYKEVDKIILGNVFVLSVATNPRPYAFVKAMNGLQVAVNGQPILEGVTLS